MTEQQDLRRWFDLEQAAIYTALPTKCLRRAIANGDLPFARPGSKKMIVDKRDLDAWLIGLKVRLN